MPLPRRSHTGPLPVETVRDLLGLARALYRAERDGAGDPVRLQALEEIGKEYRLALDMARTEPNTVGHRAAWVWSEKATEALCVIVEADLKVGELVTAMTRAVWKE